MLLKMMGTNEIILFILLCLHGKFVTQYFSGKSKLTEKLLQFFRCLKYIKPVNIYSL
jgi:hypothetical protein